MKFEDMDRYCQRCGELLNNKKMKMLELSQDTGLFSDPDKGLLPENESQGGFTFGLACAKAVLKNGGECVAIRERKRRDR